MSVGWAWIYDFGSAYIELMGIRRAPVLWVLALGKDEASKEPEQDWECTMDPTEV
jgi:hypothetical protein